jgi:ABC-type sugar transport system ATPase subunit
MASVRINNLEKQYGSITATKDVSLDIADGELVVFVGPSGCGKTTLLRMVAGLETPTSGDIRFDGQSVIDLPPQDRDISMVFQDLALYPHLRAIDNIKFALKADRSVGESEYDRRATQIAKLANCDEFLDKSITELSGGQRQRVAIARALVREPEVFLLDEPLSDLDELMKRRIRASIERLQKDLRITTIHVTHDQEEAMTMADKIVVLNSGTVEQVGSPAMVFGEPVTLFVASFIGSPQINQLSCTVTGAADNSLALDSETGTVTLSPDMTDRLDARTADRITIGVRPQHLIWNDDEPDDARLTIPVTIDVLEQTGTEDIARCATPDSKEVIAVVPTGTLSEGYEGYLTADESSLHLFNGDTDNAERLN